MAKLIAMPPRDQPPVTPWAALGFDTERDMLIDDLQALAARIKDVGTPAHAIAALSKRKHEILEKIKLIDSGEDGGDILDDSEDEVWDVGG